MKVRFLFAYLHLSRDFFLEKNQVFLLGSKIHLMNSTLIKELVTLAY